MNKSQNVCTNCGNLLIETTRIVRQSANPLYPITVIQYRCTNEPCQANTDRRIIELAQERLEREERSKKSHNNFSKTHIR